MPRLTLVPKKFFIILVSFFAFTVFVGYLLEEVIPQIKDKKSLPFVKSIHLDEATIAGTNIPPIPNEVENNATLLGVDANKNYIRDDVELAIYAKYSSSTQERVALLGYAQALEMRYRVSWKEGQEYTQDKISSFQDCLWWKLNPLSQEYQGDSSYFKTPEFVKRKGILAQYENVTRGIMDNTNLRREYIKTSNKTFLSYGGFSLSAKVCPLDFNKIK